MTWENFLWTTLGVALTLSTFSFLYRDNPFYKFSESLFVGVSAGYFTMILWYNGLVPTLFDKLALGQWWYVIPGILGLMMWFRFSKKKSWISRYPIAFYLGIATGVAIPLEMQNRVNRQLANTMSAPDFSVGFISGVSDIIIIVGVFTALFYFFFSVAHKGTYGGVAKTGIYVLMVGFGASFGYTVMARISLFIQRVQAIRDWIDMGNDGPGGFMVVIWLVVLAILLLILLEIIRHMRKKETATA
jgi:hypothetical protein